MKRDEIPSIVEEILVFHQCWLVGSGAKWFMKTTDPPTPRDWDLIAPQSEFAGATKRLANAAPDSVEINSMGGLKFHTKKCTIDIWTDTISSYTEIASKTKHGTDKIRAVRLNPRIELKDLS